MVVDAEQHDELGLALVRGPFETLEAAQAVIDEVRAGPAPRSSLAARAKTLPRAARVAPGGPRGGGNRARSAPAPAPEPPPLEIRSFRSGDGERLRALWDACGMHGLGDDDESLAVMNRRNPGLMLLAIQAGRVVGSALGGWDGRRGWIYHVATLPSHRRSGLARDLVRRIEAKLREQGAPKVNVMVRESNTEGAAFWRALGYALHDSRQYGKELGRDGG